MSAEKVKDPICGMMVDPSRAIKLNIEGETHYFCSDRCADQFKKRKAK